MGSDNLTSVLLKFNDDMFNICTIKILFTYNTAPSVSAFGGDKEVFLDWNNEFNRQGGKFNSTHLPFEGYKLAVNR